MSILAGISLIRRLGNGTYMFERRGPGHRDARGLWVPGTVTTFTAEAAVHPAGPRELVPLPEGRELRDVRVIYAEVPLSADPTAGPDVLLLGGERFALHAVQHYQRNGFSIWQASAAKQELP